MYLGIDGCRAGWVVADIDEEKKLSHRVIASLQALKDDACQLALIDIPLDFAEQTYRPCEIEAQKLLGSAKRASIFLTPHRQAVFATSYPEANRLNRLYLGKGLSVQSWNICGKIKEAIGFIGIFPAFPLCEAHPELSFYFLNNRRSLLSKKANKEGAAERLEIISRCGNNYPEVIGETLRNTKRKDVKMDDIIDATILAIRAAASDIKAVPAGKSTGDRAAILY